MTGWVAQVSAAVAALVVATGAFWWGYLRLLRSTDRRQLRANGLVRWGRRWRTRWIVRGLAVAAWPHVVEVLLRLTRTPTALSQRTAVGRFGAAVLWRYEGPQQGPPVLLVHSVVTRPTVLDLTPGLSLVEALVAAGHDVWLLDWGTVTRAQASWGLDAYADVLIGAERHIADATGEAIDVVGYCAGGTLAAAVHGAHGPGPARSLTLIASPLDTAVAGGFLATLTRPVLLPGLALDGDGLVPGSYVREAFHALRPQAVRTMRKVIRLRRSDFRRAAAGALGRWAWEQTPVPGTLFFDIVDLARSNALVTGRLLLHGQRVDLARLSSLDLLVVTTVRDHIVTPASSSALKAVGGLQVDELLCTGGHVSMIAGAEAHRVLYPGLTRWLAARGGAGAPPRR